LYGRPCFRPSSPGSRTCLARDLLVTFSDFGMRFECPHPTPAAELEDLSLEDFEPEVEDLEHDLRHHR
jgi:hypothetical protein